jgi:hypothetical protein
VERAAKYFVGEAMRSVFCQTQTTIIITQLAKERRRNMAGKRKAVAAAEVGEAERGLVAQKQKTDAGAGAAIIAATPAASTALKPFQVLTSSPKP